jgi:hypothetical protein
MIDQPLNELSCRIFLDADPAQRGLAELLSGVATAEASPGTRSPVIRSAKGELELRRNEDWDNVSARGFPDGFLHFRCVLEFYPRADVRHEAEVDYLARLLDRLWSSGVPAVASCDYENELPHHGGYSDASLPWPSPIFNGGTDGSAGREALRAQGQPPVSPAREGSSKPGSRSETGVECRPRRGVMG